MHKMQLEDEKTWPVKVVAFLERNEELFRNWKTRFKPIDPKEYDKAITHLRAILRDSDYTLQGYHCTRLTEEEIQSILVKGMSLPSAATLRERIENLRQNGLIDSPTANYLLSKNEADDSNRAGMIWFCFFPPRVEGQLGIERFFRSWGGEALYNSHEDDKLSGHMLTKIGTPCLIEAYIPIESLAYHGGLDFKLIAHFLRNRGLKPDNPIEHEDRAQHKIPAENIIRVIRFHEPDFMKLTGCAKWKPVLS
ncbi:hypothetical protein IC229_22430 [Spirosoma sp. BT702]|uniref:Uncharacterized protein n=1 Tax=Spirosoma profusum TaxID=2771354 RepID=A0A926XYU9_9BACT|nr:hypothetical protein [Spirosoma profusum]MBD2703418.1 hypothetical protein [Spirosoma profusum]